MVDLGQTGGRDSACLFFVLFQIKKPTAFTIGFYRVNHDYFYFSVAYNLATSVQLTTLKKASI